VNYFSATASFCFKNAEIGVPLKAAGTLAGNLTAISTCAISIG
jgi:hypothetical protein